MTGSVAPSAASAARPDAGDRQLEGPRIVGRMLAERDAPAFVKAAMASRRLHGRWVQPPLSVEEFRLRIHRNAGASSMSWLMRRRDDAAIAGLFNLSEIIRGPLQQAFLGYYAFAPHAGAGYMREGMALVLADAFGALQLHRIEANIQPENVRSIALVEACGFVREGFSERYLKIAGRWRDHERWAINAERWLASRRRQRAQRR